MVSLTSTKKGWLKLLRSLRISFPIDLDSLGALSGFLDTYFMITCLLGRQLHGLFFPLSLSLSFFAELICSSRGRAAGFWETICSLRAGHSGERPWIRLLTQRRHLALCSLLFLLAVFWDELSFYYWAKWSSFSTEGQNSLSSVPDPVTTRTEYARLKVW